MRDFFQFVVSGLSQGAIYALVAVGFSVIYRATHVVNFAQGEFVMLGGLGTAAAISFGLPPLAAGLFAILVAIVAAFVLDRVVVRLAKAAPIVLLIIVTIGFSIALRGIAQVAWGRNFHSIPSLVGSEPIRIAGVTILPQAVLILSATVLIVVSLDWFFRSTRFGKAMIAAAINPVAATLVGIDLRRVYTATFIIAGSLGAVAGLLITPLSTIHFESGLIFGLKGFAAAILGGFGSVVGAVAGGLTLGLMEALGSAYVSSAYKGAIALVLIVAVLLVRPQGLFGTSAATRV